MLTDLDQPGGLSQDRYTLCIVGAGAVGISIAREFLTDQNISVALLESGSPGPNSLPTDLDEVINIGEVNAGGAGSRKRGIGGSTQIWGGQALPFSPIDFDQKAYLNSPTWPIHEADIKLYYPQVEQLFNVPKPHFEDDIWANDSGSKNYDFVQNAKRHKLKLHFSKFSPMPDFGSAHATQFGHSEHIDLIINASVLELVEANTDTSIDHIVIRNSNGGLHKLYADIFILCAGGIENPRLLLNSKAKSPNGVGNDGDMVGRFFQDHIGLYGARLEPIDTKKFSQLFATRFRAKVKCLPKLSLSEAQQEKLSVLNITGNIEVQADDQSPIELMRSSLTLIKNKSFGVELAKSLLKLLGSPRELASAAYCLLIEKRVYIPKHAKYFLVANIESEPIADSCIGLSTETDRFGMAKAEINWRLSDRSRLSAQAYYSLLKEFLETQNIAKVILKKELFDNSDAWKKYCYGLYHHMGATRMSKQADQGVVDENCKVHGLQNLYIAGTSVLPSGGASNPTFTALALALRLVSHLKQRVKVYSS